MRHSLEYKRSRYRKTIGYINLDTDSYSVDLKVIRNCDRYRPKIKKMYFEILQILKKYYNVIDTNYNIHKINMLSNSRVNTTIKNNIRREKNESR